MGAYLEALQTGTDILAVWDLTELPDFSTTSRPVRAAENKGVIKDATGTRIVSWGAWPKGLYKMSPSNATDAQGLLSTLELTEIV